MAKQQKALRYVAKLHSIRLRKAKWKLSVTLDELRQRGELVALGDSQMLDWIDELRGVEHDAEAANLKQQIRQLTREDTSAGNRMALKQLRQNLTLLMYKPDYLLIVMDSPNDFAKLCRETFLFNGARMKFLLATTGGVKTSTMIFVKEDIWEPLVSKLNCGRNMEKEYIPAKLEAYMSLACSASIPVSDPRGVLVVEDCITRFREDAILIQDGTGAGAEPEMRFEENAEIELIDSDGYGLMTPELSQRWGEELGEGGIVSGVNTRCAFEKGMLFTFDFKRFAHEVAHVEVVKDAWGNEVCIDDVDVILTTSMLKLWSAYDNWEHYWDCCRQYGYGFRVTKVCPQELENERTTNYQFLQPHSFTDEEVREFIQPTIDGIKDAISGDWAKTVLYAKGTGLKENHARRLANDWIKAVMINPGMMQDPYVKNRLRSMAKRRIEDAAIGVIDVAGNYSIISGDPYSLCQSICGLEVTGLLKAGSIYNRHWADKNVDEVVVYRAPMSTGNNVRVMRVSDTEAQRDWYRYMRTCTVLNSWDATCHALNGADKDSDAVLTTNDPLLLKTAPRLPVIICQQRSGTKKQVEWEDFVTANIAAAGDDIGAITNRVTGMYDLLTTVKTDEERSVLMYRIQCGQHFQQNAIDKAKGIVSEPMPKYWYDYRPLKVTDEDDDEMLGWKEFNRPLVANRKPYFMKYIYSDVAKDLRAFVRDSEAHAMREYRTSVSGLRELVNSGEATDDQREFVRNYDRYLPVSDGECVVNRICHIVEAEFGRMPERSAPFDPEILKSGGEEPDALLKRQLREIYRSYISDCQQMSMELARSGWDKEATSSRREVLREYYRDLCYGACSSEAMLCDALIDICYKSSTSKAFVWDICGDQIIHNLLKAAGGIIRMPVQDAEGDIEYHGRKYTIRAIKLEEYDEYNT